MSRVLTKNRICAKCKKPVALQSFTCDTCLSSYHRSCAVLFIKFKAKTVCCARSLGHLLPAHTVSSPTIFPPLSFPISLDSEERALLPPINMPDPASTPFPFLQIDSALPSLPDDWNSLDQSQQLARIMQTCLSSERSAQSAVLEARAIGAQLGNLATAVQTNTATCARNTNEIAALKDLRAYAQPTPEIIVTGIPASTTVSHDTIIHRVLSHLSLAGLQSDILDIRKIRRNPTNNIPNAQPSDSSPRDTFSLIVKFKSVDIRNYVIDAKRRFGRLTVADIFSDEVPGAAGNTLYVNELLPSRIYALLKSAKLKARERNYKHVWSRNGTIFIRKSDNSQELPIFSEQDLTNLE